MTKDILRRFILDNANIRGEWVHLDDSWQELLERSDYPPVIRNVLGEALSAIVLLSATVKHQGSMILQIRGDGPVHLLVVQATPQGTVRGLARWGNVPEGISLPEIFGSGHIAITMDAASNGERYQGIIALEGNNLTEALEQYFQRSEQLPTRLWLSANHHSSAGLLLQRLPDASQTTPEQKAESTEDWTRVSMLLDTLTADELHDLPPEELVYRLFHEEEPRLFAPKPIRFHCGCGVQRVEAMLQSMGQTEADSILAEHGSIEVTCEFCNAQYSLDRVDVARLFAGSISPADPSTPTIH